MTSTESVTPAYLRLSTQILRRASLRGNEYAWSVANIPLVIAAARDAGLVNVGGQLQFRMPDGGTCECYWVEVDTYKAVSRELSWEERVLRTADVALNDFTLLTARFDILDEGGRSFGSHLQVLEDKGSDPAETMCFVWYVVDPTSEISIR